MEYCHRNKIFLTEDIILKIKDIETNFKLIKPFFEDEINLISELEEYHASSDVQIIYADAEDEVNSIKTRIDRLKAKPGVTSFEEDIKGMRKLVEEYFKELTS